MDNLCAILSGFLITTVFQGDFTMLKITGNMSEEQISLALNASLLNGFMSETAVFPTASADGDVPVPESYESLYAVAKDRLCPDADSTKPLPFVKDTLYSLDFRGRKGLENLFCDGMFLKDTDSDFFPDSIDVKFILPDSPDTSIVCAACNFAFRFGMETTAYNVSDLLADKTYSGNAMVFTGTGKAEAVMEQKDGFYRIYINGSGKELEDFSALVCEKFPLTTVFDRWSDTLVEMTRDFAMETADGQLAYLDATGKTAVLYHTPDLESWQKKHCDNDMLVNRKAGLKAYSKSYDIPWEADTLLAIMEQQVYPLINKGDTVVIKGAVSENVSVRTDLSKSIACAIAQKGAAAENIQLVNAYKQGFSWLTEFIMPQLEKLNSTPDRIEILFRPFLPHGVTEWADENGATPNRTRGLENNPDKWFDLPIRWLQELYPVDDILSQKLGISRANIVFTPLETEEDTTYLVRAYCGEKAEFSACYKAYCSERPYMDEYPQLGLVHPSTAYISVEINGKAVFETTFKTDLENVWDIYQAQVLPDCRRYIENKFHSPLNAANQPFFQKLHLDIQLSEEEYSLPCREDIISPLSALHEDLYFTGGDYFKYYGQSMGQNFDAPGLILPDLHIGKGKPAVNVTLYEQLSDKAKVTRNGHIIHEEKPTESINLYISRLGMENGSLTVYISAYGIDRNVLQSYAQLWSKGALQKSRTVQNCGKIVFICADGSCFEALCTPDEIPEKTKNISDIDIVTDKVIGYDEYLDIIGQLKQVKGIEVFPVAKSYKGRTIYAIWFKKEHKGYLSLTKYLSNRTSQFINARHHANEVSSTNAAFMLLKELLTNKKYADLADKLSLVIVPVENADGTAIHFELQKEHPVWQLHTARFNALGREFAYEYFNADPLSTEALATSRVYGRFVPDIMVDNHGVPSHEWDQQFSGYTSPAYKGFWLPRSLLYGYFWYVKEAEYAANIEVNKKMEAAIADAIAADAEMTALNKEWTSVFEKYAHSWMPKLFPAEYYGDMINYWIGYNMNHRHMYTAIRYPWLTSVAYTSEVADETAQGNYLSLCAKAHFVHDVATIDMLLCGHNSFEKQFEVTGSKVKATYRRVRPVKV